MEPCFGAQHFPVSFELDLPDATRPHALEERPANFHFNHFDILRVQTALEIELRLMAAMDNPSPQFMLSRLTRMLHNQGRINRQALVPASESWQFFLTDNDRIAIVELEIEEKRISECIQSGSGGISDREVREFYQNYRASFENWKRKASEKMWESNRDRSRNHGQTWKLLKRIRGGSRAVPIEPGKLLRHFQTIFFDPSRPLSIHYPTLDQEPVYGPFLEQDYHLSNRFSIDELNEGLRSLNKDAGVGPGRVSSKWVVKIFSTDGAKEYLLLLFNQCFLWGACPNEWSHSELFVIYKGKGDMSDPNNYRAINLLDDFYRLYSRLLYKRLTGWAARYNYFSQAQFGFRPSSGTLEAVISLQTIIRAWHLRSNQPVSCVFLDIKKAFPSVDRVELIRLLHRLGLPGPMVKALASTFSMNVCRLRVEGYLTEPFPVNLGVREGDIDSPPLFNLVYGEILRVCDLDLLDETVFSPNLSKAIGIAYADDLAGLGISGEPLQDCLFAISEAMLPFNLRVNAGKTQELIFLPARRTIPISDVIPFTNFFVEDEWLEVVTEFKYLGIHLDFSVDTSAHLDICFKRAKQAAVQIGRLCNQLRIVDFSRLRTYFFSFVVSQFHGYQIVTFPEAHYEQVLMLFFRNCLSLPVGFPRAIFYFLVGSLEFSAQQIIARFRFFQKHARSNTFMRSIFVEDRRLFLLNQICWNSDFRDLYEGFLPGNTFSELDLFDPQDDLRFQVEVESSNRRELRLSLMPSGVLFRELLPYRVMPSFLRELSRRSFEETRLVLIYFANMFRFCFFGRSVDRCPLCQSEFLARHLFECPQVAPFAPIRIDGWRDLAYGEEWRDFLDLFFVVCFLWTRRSNQVRQGHAKTAAEAIRMFLV
jgi:hypothetical protein